MKKVIHAGGDVALYAEILQIGLESEPVKAHAVSGTIFIEIMDKFYGFTSYNETYILRYVFLEHTEAGEP